MEGPSEFDFDYETDYIKQHWQIEALKGQLRELNRELNRTGNLLTVTRFLFIKILTGMGVEENLNKMNDGDLLVLVEKKIREDWRFSRCPNAARFKCRPVALHVDVDDDVVGCDDCGWSILENPPKVEVKKSLPKPPKKPKPASSKQQQANDER